MHVDSIGCEKTPYWKKTYLEGEAIITGTLGKTLIVKLKNHYS